MTDPIPRSGERQQPTPEKLLFSRIDALFQHCTADFADLPRQRVDKIVIYFGDITISRYDLAIEYFSDGLTYESYSMLLEGDQLSNGIESAITVSHTGTSDSQKFTVSSECFETDSWQVAEAIDLYSSFANALLSDANQDTTVEVTLISTETLPITEDGLGQARTMGASAITAQSHTTILD